MAGERAFEKLSPPEGESQSRRTRRGFPRWAVVGIGAILGFALVFLVGGGWFFSSQIGSDALAVDADDSPDLEIEVVSVGEGTITFVLGDEPEDDLVSDEILGVAWATGYGQVGSLIDQTDTSVERVFGHLTGEQVEVGDLVDLEGYAFPADAAGGLGIAVEEVRYSSPFGEFDAWYVPGTNNTWVVFVHGRGAHPRESFRPLPAVVEAGHPALIIFYRNDVGQPETSDRRAGFGSTEWEDLDGAVQYAIDQGAENVVLYGLSMGGGIAVNFMFESDLADRIVGLILDAPALELGAMVDARADDTNLPLLPLRVPTPLTTVAKWLASVRYDLDWDDLDYLDRAGELSVPILLFHGAMDDTVPVELSDQLAETRPDLVTYLRFDDAGHVRSWNVDPVRYEQALTDFLVRVR